ncbi:MAG: zinc ribbon domain-containing protein [Candidatus Methanomethylophilaceae archaeon]|nr:zinc ribbon domain-containing protein [Candidatus Methanomethylophilaceae archaeon]MBR7153467.1 zinc ribbon domain-containing protein [Candidatus Methanomethylophilaceae archaeon]
MKCPKCGFENPEGTLFCQECDWRVDYPYTPEKKRNPAVFSGLAVLLGIVTVLCAFVVGEGFAAAGIGAVGMVLSGYAIGVPRHVECDNKQLYTALAGLGIALNVVGFMYGLVLAVS